MQIDSSRALTSGPEGSSRALACVRPFRLLAKRLESLLVQEPSAAAA